MLQLINDSILSTLNLKDLQESIRDRQAVRCSGFSGSSLHVLLAHLATTECPLLIVRNDIEKAMAAAGDLETLGLEHVSVFPPLRGKPYDSQQIQDLSSQVQRSEVLQAIQDGKVQAICTSADALTTKIAPSKAFNEASILLKQGQTIAPETLSEQLTNQAYQSERFVSSPGEFAIRGGIFDVFPFSGEYPVRLEFFGDEIESIREFDPDSQRSISFLTEARLIPNASFNGEGEKENLLHYMPEQTVIVLDDSDLLLDHIRQHHEQAAEIYGELKEKDSIPPPEQLYVSPSEWNASIEPYGKILSGSFHESIAADRAIRLATEPHPSFNGSFKLLREFIAEHSADGWKTMILCSHENQRSRFEELLPEPDSDFDYLLNVQSLHEGFILPGQKLAVLTDHQLFNRYHRPKVRRKTVRGGISLKELKDLNVGDYVVHVDYGIAKFAGFKKIDVRGAVQEAAVLRYKNDSILYVNVSSLHKLQKFSGKEGKEPRITTLGSGEWARKKAATKKKVKDIARDLIQLYAKRKAQKAHAFDADTSWQTEMEARFEFEETPDQMQAITMTKQDMESEQPMDRLICGDVGFGKTEVAVRAAFKAVMDQKQVAVLVPTTILADQHAKTFAERMKDFPIVVESLSRFRTAAEQKEVIKGLKEGKVDIVIGTHRLVSKDVKFNDLGLLVIDEEQRFGVTVKEKLKKFRASVDVLTMTATPIPRTLQFSLMGARDLSIINTPPANRQPVYTEIHSFDESLVRDAILQEMSRGGQIFFVHNRVKDIEEIAEMILDMVPDVRVRTAHGQMPPAKLEKIIRDFYTHSFDLLVSTNIVENGIDISNANTIIINNANHFGLSELHQLRGRVGRSNRKAFCYLITPPVRNLSADARKRLLALEEYSDLGAGFNIAMRDLDIRGAGDILGAEQSGFITDIGFEMYTKILDDAVRELKETEFSSMFTHEPDIINYPETQVEFDRSAFLDSSYVKDNVERLNLYRKLAQASTDEEIVDWRQEVTDRFGKPDEPAENLILATSIRLQASRRLIKKVTIRSNRMWLQFPKHDSPAGEQCYQSGFFQSLLLQLQNADRGYEVLQKNDAVRLIIHDVEDAEAALGVLSSLESFQQKKEEPVA
ncbi:MAG: transcription-repair coupling factor [Balneolaceae bacterium]